MFSLIAFAVQGATGYSAEIRHPKAVVEMFTSQGCHSCPPADRIMAKFAREDQILALSWHVDYWDYLGWKDTFASKSNTKRQYAYARSLEEQQVYTPPSRCQWTDPCGRLKRSGNTQGHRIFFK